MANIIQQQDLLKGLPDNRLAMLLQNPVGDIPPFLVAAEAQRRQAIRQQFAGNGSQESVVDSLTKQLANVPQNLNAPTQTPPMVPPTPPMQGVMALQQQQQMEQAAQNVQQPQMMRAGGMVQRYYDGGKVEPLWEIPDLSGTIPSIYDYIAPKVSDFAEFITKPYSEREAERAEEKEKEDRPRIFPTLPPGASGGMALNPDLPKPTMAQPIADPASEEQQPGETKEEFRARMEKLLAYREPSDWEKSQRWFAMAEQFLDPRKTTMQSVAGAGQAFAEQSAAMAAAQREAEFNKEKGLLELDMAAAERDRAEKSAQATAKIESMKYQGEQALREAEFYRKAADDAKNELADYTKDGLMIEADDPRVAELRTRIAEANKNAQDAIRRAQYFQYQYGTTYGTYGTPESWDGRQIVR